MAFDRALTWATGWQLDTQILVWLRLSPQKLTDAERNALESASLRQVSAASLWEIAILLGLGRIRAPAPEAKAALLTADRQSRCSPRQRALTMIARERKPNGRWRRRRIERHW